MPRHTRPSAFILVVVASLLVVGACARGSGDREDTVGGGTSTEGALESSSTSRPAGTAPDRGGRAQTGPSTAVPATEPPDTAPPTTAVPTTVAPTTTTEPPPPPIEVGDLQSGVEGPRTLAVQQQLKALAYDPGAVDGRFGRQTTMAVWAFQALRGMPRDGIVTAPVEQALMAGPPQTMLRPDLGPTHTEVDLDRQVLLVWDGGGLELVTHISSGSGQSYCEDGHCGDAVTPVGDYRYQRRIAGERQAPLGVLYDPVYFTGGIAVHGAPSVPNHPASHGCVRIPMHISDYFQALVADGEPIATFRGGTGPSGVVPVPGAPPEAPPAGAELWG